MKIPVEEESGSESGVEEVAVAPPAKEQTPQREAEASEDSEDEDDTREHPIALPLEKWPTSPVPNSTPPTQYQHTHTKRLNSTSGSEPTSGRAALSST